MDMWSRIANQSTIYYAQSHGYEIAYGGAKKRKSTKPSTKEWVLRTFYPGGKSSASVARIAPLPNDPEVSKNMKDNEPVQIVHTQAQPPPGDGSGHDGEPAVCFEQVRIDSAAEKFKFCLVGKFPRFRPSLKQIRMWVSVKFRLRGEWSVTLLDRNHVLIRLDNEDDMLCIWPRNRWFGRGHMMKVFKWTLDFQTSDGEPSSAAVWVSFPSLPVVFFEQDLLYDIASLIGGVLSMDVPTRKLSRTNIARVCVEIDLLKELPQRVWVGTRKRGFWQAVKYEKLPSYCTNCRQQGHSIRICKFRNIVSESQREHPNLGINELKLGVKQMDTALQNPNISVKDAKHHLQQFSREKHYQTCPTGLDKGDTIKMQCSSRRTFSSYAFIQQKKRGKSKDANSEDADCSNKMQGQLHLSTDGPCKKTSNDISTMGNLPEEDIIVNELLGKSTERQRKGRSLLEVEIEEEEEEEELKEDDEDVKESKVDIVDKKLNSDHKDERNKASSIVTNQLSEKRSPPSRKKKTIFFWTRKAKQKTEFFRNVSSAYQPTKGLDVSFHHIKRFAVRELQVATDNFANQNIVGRGGFGNVYKGRLADGSLVAVKRLKEEKTAGGELQFQTEVDIRGVAVHRNLLQLIGFCMSPTERLLVYPYMENRDVASYLRDREPSVPPLNWPRRKRIAVGSALGLSYLHEQIVTKIIHRDVKAANTALMARLFSAILLLLLSAASFSAAARDVDTHTWGPFYTSNLSFLTASGDAAISGGALQITPDSFNNRFSLLHRSGRMTYNHPFRLWSGDPSSPAASAEIASFNTSFTVNIFRPGNLTAGEGLAFIIAPSGVVPNGSTGQWLGLTNSTIDGNPSNRFIAVELDTVMNPNVGDPDDNHIGLDINSVVSNLTVPLSTLDIELSPKIPANWTVWIDYSAATMAFRAFIDKEGRPRPSSPVINKTLDLRQIVDQNSYFGFAASTGDNAELNCVLFWNLTVEILPEDKDGKTVVLAIAIAVPVAVLILAAALVAAWWWGWRKRWGTEDERMIEGALKSLPGMPREFRLKELKKATNGFDDKQKLGEGGFGVVYKGFVSGVMAGEPAREVAVKKFSRENVKGMDDFLQELTIINRLRHKHLVKLVGWCHANGMLLLVYDYMPNGSLDAHLFRDGDDGGSVGSGKPLLPWDRRYSILAGVASALNYLHHEYDQTVVHRDLKASNILLDSDFTARLGDFGLARALDSEKTSYADLEAAGVPGTLGYIAPECFHTGKATRESDVFGFGAVILEVVCGRRPRSNVSGFSFLVDWVWTLYREDRILESVDLRLNGDYPTEDAERLLKLGLACCHPIAVERPKTQAIVQIISKSVPPPWVPPIKPSFIWPMAGGGMGGDDSSSVMTNDTTPITSSFYGSQYLSRDSQDNSMM